MSAMFNGVISVLHCFIKITDTLAFCRNWHLISKSESQFTKHYHKCHQQQHQLLLRLIISLTKCTCSRNCFRQKVVESTLFSLQRSLDLGNIAKLHKNNHGLTSNVCRKTGRFFYNSLHGLAVEPPTVLSLRGKSKGGN